MFVEQKDFVEKIGFGLMNHKIEIRDPRSEIRRKTLETESPRRTKKTRSEIRDRRSDENNLKGESENPKTK